MILKAGEAIYYRGLRMTLKADVEAERDKATDVDLLKETDESVKKVQCFWNRRLDEEICSLHGVPIQNCPISISPVMTTIFSTADNATGIFEYPQ